MHLQVVLDVNDTEVRRLLLPSPNQALMGKARWGAFERPFTAAFWAARAFLEAPLGALDNFRLGHTLSDEVAACLLGGYGIPAEVGIAAFERLHGAGALEPPVSARVVHDLLRAPLSVAGRLVRYRFAAQKSARIAAALNGFIALELPATHRAARDALRRLPGVGYKTASWITRNWWQSDDVAILDVHVCRACELAGIFEPDSNPSKNYQALESRFLEFARTIGVRASQLDNLIWQTMRRLPARLVRDARAALVGSGAT